MADFSDVLTVAKNLVVAVNGIATTYLNVQGAINQAAISTATLVKTGQGRVASVSVTTAGNTTGLLYDGGSLTATTRPIWVIPTTLGVTFVNLPTSYGLVVAPGAGQVVTVSYS